MSASERLTVERIARALDISSTTVSRALSGKGRVSEATRTRVLEYISRSGGDTTLLDRRREERAARSPREPERLFPDPKTGLTAAQAARLLEQEMEGVAKLSVPLVAEAHYGRNWLEAKG